MSTASQQRTYTTGLNVTATILNTEFGNTITHINTLYGFIDDNTGSAPITVDTTNNYVGIGTTSPTTGLHIDTSSIVGLSGGDATIRIQDEDNTGRILIESYANGGFQAPSYEGVGANGTIASPTATVGNHVLVQLAGGGYDNAGTPAQTGNKGMVQILAAENFTTSAQGTVIVFQGTPTGSTTRAIIARLDETGFYPNTDNAIDLGQSGKRWDDVYATNGTIQTSDGNDKEDIVASSLGLDFLLQLRPVEYKWKKSYKKQMGEYVEKESSEKRKHTGLIAQEVETALNGVDFAGLVKDAESGKYGLRYNEFVPVLIKAIQELNEKVAKEKK